MPQFTLGYVYQLGDFGTSGGLDAIPDEQGARAQGSPPWDIQLNAGASPLQIVVDDDDNNFNEINGGDQTLVNPVTIDGVTYPAGSSIIINYVITTDSGFEGYSITIGANNTGNNTTTAFVTNSPLVPGQTYTFTSEGNIGNSNNFPYSDFACFVAGSKIATPAGVRAIEELKPGDLVETLDDGPQPIRWIGKSTVGGLGRMAPVVFKKGALDSTADLAVSPNHRMLIEGAPAEMFLGHSSAFVAAKALVNGQTVQRAPQSMVTYLHLMFDKHQVIWANGVLSESFYACSESLALMADEQTEELAILFPGGFKISSFAPVSLARPDTRLFEGRLLADLVR